jgi:hypothetical protein
MIKSNSPASSTSFDEILVEKELKSPALKYLPRWPPVTIDFEDLVYTVQNEDYRE